MAANLDAAANPAGKRVRGHSAMVSHPPAHDPRAFPLGILSSLSAWSALGWVNGPGEQGTHGIINRTLPRAPRAAHALDRDSRPRPSAAAVVVDGIRASAASFTVPAQRTLAAASPAPPLGPGELLGPDTELASCTG